MLLLSTNEFANAPQLKLRPGQKSPPPSYECCLCNKVKCEVRVCFNPMACSTVKTTWANAFFHYSFTKY